MIPLVVIAGVLCTFFGAVEIVSALRKVYRLYNTPGQDTMD